MKRIPLYKILELTGFVVFIAAFIFRIYYHLNTAVYYTIVGALILLFMYANALKKKQS